MSKPVGGNTQKNAGRKTAGFQGDFYFYNICLSAEK